METGPTVTGPVNLGNPVEFTISDLAREIIALTGSRSTFIHRDLPQDDPQQRRPDTGLAERLLNWSPTVPLDEGLKRTVAYFSARLAELQPVSATA
jgi:UDP-glucuronate decarboxylase